MKEEFIHDESFIIEQFEKHLNLFKEHLQQVDDVKNYTTLWSNAFLESYPFQYEMNQLPTVKLFRRKPINQLGKIESRLINNKVYFAKQIDNEIRNVSFYMEDKNRMILRYVMRNNQMLLSQINYLVIKDSNIQKRIYFMRDEKDAETFMVDIYEYDESCRIHSINRNGYYKGKSKILPERVFRFEYNDNNVEIYSKQLISTGLNEIKIFPK